MLVELCLMDKENTISNFLKKKFHKILHWVLKEEMKFLNFQRLFTFVQNDYFMNLNKLLGYNHFRNVKWIVNGPGFSIRNQIK